MPRHESMATVDQLGQDISLAIARGTSQLLAARLCFMASGYVISIILARGLGPAEYGIYGVILSVLTWIEVVASAGLPGAMAKLIPQYGNQADVVEQTGRILLLVISLLIFLLCWILAPTFARFFNISAGTTLFRLAILDIPLTGIYVSYQGALHGHRRFGELSIALITYGMTKLAGIAALFHVGLSMQGALIVNVLATGVVLVYLVYSRPLFFVHLSHTIVGPILWVALPMGVYIIAMQILLNLDLWSLKTLWKGPGEVIGAYVAALNVSKVLIVVASVVADVLFASISWAVALKDEVAARRYMQGTNRIAFLILAPAFALLFLDAEAILIFLFSSAYATGQMYLRLQLGAFGMLVFLEIFLNALMAGSKYGQSVGVLLLLIPVQLLLNLILIPQFGAVGAAASSVITFSTGAALATVLAVRRFGSLIRLSTLAKGTGATVLVAVVSTQIALAGTLIIIKLLSLILLYGLLLAMFGELTSEDFKAFHRSQILTRG